MDFNSTGRDGLMTPESLLPLFKGQLVRMGLSPAWFTISSQKIVVVKPLPCG